MNLNERDLSINMTGGDVRLLHSEMRLLGYDIDQAEIERYLFGKTTELAVYTFQKANGIIPTGIVDEETAQKINEAFDAYPRIVEGIIYLEEDQSQPYPNADCEVRDQDMLSSQVLGRVRSNAEGFYRVTYNLEQFRENDSPKEWADIVVRVYSQDGTQIGESNPTIFQAGVFTTVNVLVNLPVPKTLSEYEELLALLEPVVQGVQPADLTDDNLQFLVGELNIDLETLTMLRLSAQLGRETELPTEVFYGLAREGLPLNLEQLLNLPSANLRSALENAITNNVIPAATRDILDQILARFEQLRLERGLLSTRQISGQLLTEGSNAPLINFQVKLIDQDAELTFQDRGSSFTNALGIFTNSYVAPADITDRMLLFQISTPQGQIIHEAEILVQPDQNIIPVLVPASAIPQPPSPSLAEVSQTLSLQLPQEIQGFLAQNDIRTLADIRKTGGLKNLDGLPVASDDAVVRILEAHANLNVISTDVANNAYLIDQGFWDFNAIANATRATFVSTTHEELGDFKAAQIHVKAQAGVKVLDNIATSIRVDQANGSSESAMPILSQTATPFASTSCFCEDCNAAVSPGAYLADLLDYALKHIKPRSTARPGDNPLTLDMLQERFHQPFGNLPTDCEAVEEKVRQVRICVEVLRRYMRANGRSASSADEQRYRLSAYSALLRNIGTSYEEVRLNRTNEESRERLAARLGIESTHLNDLLLDPAIAPPAARALTEEALERLFGLPATQNADSSLPDPLRSISTSQLQEWRLAYLRQQWFSEDWPSTPVENPSPLIDPDVIGQEHLKNPLLEADPARQLWQARKDTVNARLSTLNTSRTANVTSQSSFDTWIEGELETITTRSGEPLIGDLFDRTEIELNDSSVSTRLIELKVTRAEFLRLRQIRQIVASDASSVLLSEWEEVYAILVQVQKRYWFTEWRDQERTSNITVSPTYFAIPEPLALTFPPPEPEPLPTWRATERDRRNWLNSLKARIEQEQVVIEAIRQAVSTSEEESLPALRDALVQATEAADESDKAKVITNKLLIDAKAGSCQMATRIGQAIETLQQLLWSLRTDQLKDNYGYFTLDADNFDAEWTWIGSYATWRAAMFVYLYPENILPPELRKWQSPAFRELVNTTSRSRRLTPQQACEAAKTYSQYFRDVCNLEVTATCRTECTPNKVSCRSQESRMSGNLDLLFMFARSTVSNILYWSTFNLKDNTDYAQTFWMPVNSMSNVTRILGAPVCKTSNNERLVLVFVQIKDGEQEKIGFLKYNLAIANWEGEFQELELPSQNVAKIESITISQATSENQLPAIAILVEQVRTIFDPNRVPERARWRLYFGKINSDCTDWEQFEKDSDEDPNKDDSQSWSSNFRDFTYPPIIKALIGSENVYDYRIYYTTSQGSYSHLVTIGRDFYWRGANTFEQDSLNPYQCITNLNIKQSGAASVLSVPISFSKGTLSSRKTIYSRVRFSPSISERGELEFAIDQIAHNSDVSVNQQENAHIYLVCRIYERYFGFTHLVSYLVDLKFGLSESNKAVLTEIRRLPVTPIYFPDETLSSFPFTFDITSKLNHLERQKNKQLLAKLFSQNSRNSNLNKTYLRERGYFVSIHLALQLQKCGYHLESLDWFKIVYDFSVSSLQRQIYPFVLDDVGDPTSSYERSKDWLLDPLNPHSIASTRPGTYIRFTLMAIIQCVLDYANAEFSLDTAESIPRARTLYMTALELLDVEALKQTSACDDLIGWLNIPIGEQEENLRPVLYETKKKLAKIYNRGELERFSEILREAYYSNASGQTRSSQMREILDQVVVSMPPPLLISTVVNQKDEIVTNARKALIAKTEFAEAVTKTTDAVGKKYLSSVARVAKLSPEAVEEREQKIPWLVDQGTVYTNSNTLGSIELSPDQQSQLERPGRESFYPDPGIDLNGTFIISRDPVPSLSFQFCIPPNPILEALRLSAELNLYKIRTCRNIAGMERQLDPYSAPTDKASGMPKIGPGGQLILPGVRSLQPTQYRYSVLIERAKQLVQLAGQVESSMLSSIEKRDAEAYSERKARQDVELTRQGIRLQDLRIREAENGEKLAELQQERSQIQVDYYQSLLDEGLLDQEEDSLLFLKIAAAAYASASVASAIGPTASAVGVLSNAATAASTLASIFSQEAAFERRRQEWEFQRNLAWKDVEIGTQGVVIAKDRVRIVGQEKEIAKLQSDHANDTLEFLSKKFTNVELYDWMSNVLEGVYSFFLQQATAVAKLAENQLAFERQEVPPTFIQADYWEAPTEDVSASLGGEAPDRRGLTGSARLLQDIYQLDQYAFDTDKRKQQLTKTISLARLAPAEFQRFRETGILLFSTPMALFDRGFQGHYLRLIKRVRTSIIALIPPTEGIHATLSTTGASRVVIGGDIFQTVVVRRSPETVALTAPRDATGLFEFQPQPEFLLPFEGNGVDSSWEFRLPKSSNFFDFDTIADVQITFEFTALNSFDYRQQVIRELDREISGDRPFSFRNQFADAWYDLNNPSQTATPMIVQFETRREDFPPNIEELSIQHTLLYFVRADGTSSEISVENFRFTYRNEPPVGGPAQTIDGVISTRRSNGSAWSSLMGKTPLGKWELDLTTLASRELFENEQIEDILFVITYRGLTAPWDL